MRTQLTSLAHTTTTTTTTSNVDKEHEHTWQTATHTHTHARSRNLTNKKGARIVIRKLSLEAPNYAKPMLSTVLQKCSTIDGLNSTRRTLRLSQAVGLANKCLCMCVCVRVYRAKGQRSTRAVTFTNAAANGHDGDHARAAGSAKSVTPNNTDVLPVAHSDLYVFMRDFYGNYLHIVNTCGLTPNEHSSEKKLC